MSGTPSGGLWKSKCPRCGGINCRGWHADAADFKFRFTLFDGKRATFTDGTHALVTDVVPATLAAVPDPDHPTMTQALGLHVVQSDTRTVTDDRRQTFLPFNDETLLAAYKMCRSSILARLKDPPPAAAPDAAR